MWRDALVGVVLLAIAIPLLMVVFFDGIGGCRAAVSAAGDIVAVAVAAAAVVVVVCPSVQAKGHHV